jgi:hypothetical protein
MIGHIGIFKDPEEVQVHFCFRSSDGTLGDSMRIVRPGEFLYGWSYDAIRAHGEGAMEFSLPPRFREVGKPGDAFVITGASKPRPS